MKGCKLHVRQQGSEWHDYVAMLYFFLNIYSWSCVIFPSSTDKTQTDPAPNQSPSHQTNLAFGLSEDGFTRLLLAGLLIGRSLKRLSLVCGNGMLDPNLLTTTSSLPPISTVRKESRNYSPAQNLALSSPGGWKACECVVSLLQFLCVVTGSDVGRLYWGSGLCVAACLWAEWNCSWNAERSDTSHHSHLSPPTTLSGDTPCLRDWWPSTSSPLQTRMFECLKVKKHFAWT